MPSEASAPTSASPRHLADSTAPTVIEAHDDGLDRRASEPSRPASSSGGVLRRAESRQERIDAIIERGVARAQSQKFNTPAQPTTTRMEPLLGKASLQRHNPENTSDEDGLEMARPPGSRSRSAGKRKDSGTQSNYQSINTQQHGSRNSADGSGSIAHRRSTVSNHGSRRGVSQTSTGQGEHEVNGHHNEREDRGEGGLVARIKAFVALFGSVELDNKGSVARDHLALERTFLAWLRTSVSFASIGIAVTQLFRLNTSINNGRDRNGDSDPDQNELRRLGKPLGAAFLGISILILFLGYGRYVRGQRWVMAGRFPASRGTVILVTLLTFSVMVASLAIVIIFSPGGW